MLFAFGLASQINPPLVSQYDFPYVNRGKRCFGNYEVALDHYIIDKTRDSLFFMTPMRLRHYIKELDSDEVERLEFFDLISEKVYYHNTLTSGLKNRFPIHRIGKVVYLVSLIPYMQPSQIYLDDEDAFVLMPLRNSSTLKFFRIKSIENVEEIYAESLNQIEVVCQKNITRTVLDRIGNQLNAEGYLEVEEEFRFDEQFKNALYNFQYDNRLPIGLLDWRTLHHFDFTAKQIAELTGSHNPYPKEFPNFSSWTERELFEWYYKNHPNPLRDRR